MRDTVFHELGDYAFDCCDLYDVACDVHKDMFGHIIEDTEKYNDDQYVEEIYYTLEAKGLLEEFIEKYPERKEKLDDDASNMFRDYTKHGEDWD